MNPVWSNNLSLKYQKFSPSSCKGIMITKLKTQFPLTIWQFQICDLVAPVWMYAQVWEMQINPVTN